MKIESKHTAIFEFSAEDYYLVHMRDDRFGGKETPPQYVWALCDRIDRSYKGKDDDVGMPHIYLSDEQAETLMTAFTSMTMYETIGNTIVITGDATK